MSCDGRTHLECMTESVTGNNKQAAFVQPDRKVELLAPAGGWEQLEYALHFGANAVYLACDKFGLRSRAANFSLEDLPRAVARVHEMGARVFVTCNIFAHDDDLKSFPAYLQAIEASGADAVIVSDLGMLALVRQHAPSLAIHVSTQASVSNAAAANMWYQLGARRVVCAREMSLKEIAAMRKEIPDDMEIEVFVHGAMCMAVSGRCLISEFLTGRAANKGEWTQPCRWEYRLQELSRTGEEFGIEQTGQTTYLFNSKDLNMLSHLKELRQAGVDSIKIEGRVKKAFYVATVVNAYRHVLDGEDAQAWQGELETISHRPYSTGFFFGQPEQSTDADMYQQLYDWVGEVVESYPETRWDDTHVDGYDTHVNERDAHVDGCGAHAVGEFEPSRDDVCVKPGERTQVEVAADSASKSQRGRYRVMVKCRNRFYPGDTLELLSPGMPITPLAVRDLAEVFETKHEDGTVLRNEVPADSACKAMHPYTFTCDIPLRKRDILRVKRKDPSRKN